MYLVGATYENEFDSVEPTEKMLNELKRRLNKVLELEYTVVEHFAGIRPTVKDRRPLIGQHGDHQNLWIFNGMGSKAYSLAPLLSKELADSMVNNAPLHPEINYTRYC
jgi:glycine/D-amino acid oxidase-like deaminating enzyme